MENKKIPVEYFAGVADSDGSFCIGRNKRKNRIFSYYYSPAFQLTWKRRKETEKVIEEYKNNFGGNICKTIAKSKYGRCAVVKYYIGCKHLDGFLEKIIPFLILKKRQAEILLELRKITFYGKYGKHRPKPLEIWQQEEKLFQECRMLNSKNTGRGKPINAKFKT